MPATAKVPPIFNALDDAAREQGRNGKPAVAEAIRRLMDGLNSVSYSGRPVAALWGGRTGGDGGAAGLDPLYMLAVPRLHAACAKLRGRCVIAKNTHAPAGNDRGVETKIGSDAAVLTQLDYDINGATLGYPEGAEQLDVLTDTDKDPSTADIVTALRVNSVPAGSGLYVPAFLAYDAAQVDVDPDVTKYAYVPPELVGPGLEVVAEGKVLDRYRVQLRNTALHKRVPISWSIEGPGTNYVDFTTSRADFRYIFDQAIGDNGTAPSATGPALTAPWYKSAFGRRTQVRVAVWVYARMSDGDGATGTIGVANKDSGGAMQAFAALTNGPTVTFNGGTFKWWPDLNTGTPAYFNGYAGAPFDRVLLGAKASTGPDMDATVQIAAYVMLPFHHE